MPKKRLYPITTITIIITSAILGLYKIPTTNASTPSQNTNPKIIYWPPLYVWQVSEGQYAISTGCLGTRSLSWSPSGKLLLVAASDRFVVVNASTRSVINEFWNPPGYGSQVFFDSFAISPDDSRIFYVNTSGAMPSSTIYSMDLNGSNQNLITYVNSSSTCVPTFFDLTNDGTALIYTEFAYDYSSYPYTRFSRVWKINLETSERTLLLELEGPDNQIFSIKFSPTDDKIAFTTYTGVWIINPDGTSLTKIVDGSEGKIAMHLDWTLNATILTYTEVNYTQRGDYNPNISDNCGTIVAVNIDGSNKKTIFSEAGCWTWWPLDNSIAAFIKAINTGVPYLIDLNLPIMSNPDSDGDGISDREEIFLMYFNPLDPTDIHKDYDNDGLTNLEEYNFNQGQPGFGTYALNLLNRDTDGDGLSDGVEIKVFKTNPTKADTDGDGVSDGLEAAATGLSAFISVLPEGWIRMTLQWSNKTMYVSTNSSVLG
ncbi:MAG: hypothetical protein QXJ02_06715, partial [Candidatus Bathyarchaeia archaeon]